MGWSKKINTKNYAFGTIANLGLAIYAGLPRFITVWWLAFVVISAALNHFFTVKALSGMVEDHAATPRRGLKIMLYMLFKMAFLISGFACLLVFAPDKVLQGLLLYIFQLIILGLSIKNIGKFFKQGTPS